MRDFSRRAVLALPPAVGVAAGSRARTPAQASLTQVQSDESFTEAERAILAGRTPIAGGVVLDLPPLSENGNSVDLTVTAESPMTREDHVTAIHILSERNPFPRVATFHLTPRSGRAEVATRIRLATSQTLVVLAETSRGTIHRTSKDVIVILGACVETG
ncbi:sulfur oxidation protein SoxY [Roseomonas sp. KE2513]|uniref:thiosulfate oxidation carrier protein SoxY n=1 Tax=Roseomonas sp. KE2513 TaxID=2479202 RepID=UPI0018DFE9A8|nr:thiosulfate oxidation carrier protein SoxY [Roseomonas sp. KE2513]MBI0538636.1 sulfur oxidation protein SoxY [Roseomonas sp. KE2513]